MAKEKLKLGNLFKKMAPVTDIDAKIDEQKMLYSVLGFLPAADFADNTGMITNLAYLLSQEDLTVCVIDFKVFYPNLYSNFSVEPPVKGRGLIKLMRTDKVDYRDEVLKTKYKNIYLVTPSPNDLIEEYLDFKLENVSRVINDLKSMFDVVLIDIPNNPPLEFCLGAISECHLGFITVPEKTEVITNIVKILDFAASIGISAAKFTNIILLNRLDIAIDLEAFKKLNLKIVADIPFVKGVVEDALEGRIHIKDNPAVNKNYNQQINQLAQYILSQ